MTKSESKPGKSFKSENEARTFARNYLADLEIVIIHSPHRDNKHGDYFVDDAANATAKPPNVDRVTSDMMRWSEPRGRHKTAAVTAAVAVIKRGSSA